MNKNAPLRIERIYYRYNEGYQAAVHGEPLNHQFIWAAVEGYENACKDILNWRETNEPLPAYIDPAKVEKP